MHGVDLVENTGREMKSTLDALFDILLDDGGDSSRWPPELLSTRGLNNSNRTLAVDQDGRAVLGQHECIVLERLATALPCCKYWCGTE